MLLISQSKPHSTRTVKITSRDTYKKVLANRVEQITIIVDLLLLNSSIFTWIKQSMVVIIPSNSFIYFFIFLNFLWLLIAIPNDTYKWAETKSISNKIKDLFYVIGAYFAILISFYYFCFHSILQIHFPFLVIISFLIMSTTAHLLIKKYYDKRRPIIKYAIIGGEPTCFSFIKKVFDKSSSGKSNCVGWLTTSTDQPSLYLESYEKIKDFIIQNTIDKVFYINSNLKQTDLQKIIELCDRKLIDFQVLILPREKNILTGKTRIIYQEELPILAMQIEPLERLHNKIFKRCFDIIFSLFVLLTIFPWLFPLISLLIKLESNGPVFFTQKRTGYWNKTFDFFKFRSMSNNNNTPAKQVTQNDDRVTRFGNFLRKTSLDELPQFFNVLIGDMSVVGPRPHMVEHTIQYTELINTYMVRHKVKPGITGWAQIHGLRGPTETVDKMEQRVNYDVFYIKNWNFWMDIQCIIMTVYNIIFGEENAI